MRYPGRNYLFYTSLLALPLVALEMGCTYISIGGDAGGRADVRLVPALDPTRPAVVGVTRRAVEATVVDADSEGGPVVAGPSVDDVPSKTTSCSF